MKIEDELDVAVRTFCNMKRMMCEREGGPYDLHPMLHFKYKHLKAYAGILLKGNPLEEAPVAWRKIMDHGTPEFVMLMVEGYASTKVDDYERGRMERDFKDNPDSEVREVITLQAVDIKTGRQLTALVPFRYGDDGLPEFEEPKVGPCDGRALEANVPSMMNNCRKLTLDFGEAA
jgi:hypothetical protein